MKLNVVIIITDYTGVFPLNIAQMITFVNNRVFWEDGFSVLGKVSHNWDNLPAAGRLGYAGRATGGRRWAGRWRRRTDGKGKKGPRVQFESQEMRAMRPVVP